MFDIFCIYLPFFYPLGVPLYAFGVKKRSSWNLLASPFFCFTGNCVSIKQKKDYMSRRTPAARARRWTNRKRSPRYGEAVFLQQYKTACGIPQAVLCCLVKKSFEPFNDLLKEINKFLEELNESVGNQFIAIKNIFKVLIKEVTQ